MNIATAHPDSAHPDSTHPDSTGLTGRTTATGVRKSSSDVSADAVLASLVTMTLLDLPDRHERRQGFRRGYEDGALQACDTFNTGRL